MSQAFFRRPAKAGSYRPIHEISSRNTIVRSRERTADASASNALAQQSAFGSGRPVACARRSQKFSSCRAFVIFFSGGNPAISMNVQPERRANSSTSVDLPMRRRPDTTTSDDARLRHNASSLSRYSSRPKNSIRRQSSNSSVSAELYHILRGDAIPIWATKCKFTK